MWIIHEPKKVALWNKRHFEEKNGECAACLKILSTYSCWKNIYKMQHLEGSGTSVLYIGSTVFKSWTTSGSMFHHLLHLYLIVQPVKCTFFNCKDINFLISSCFDDFSAIQVTIYILLQKNQKILYSFNHNKSIKTIRI
jgi:hypothetical protein